MEDLEPLLDAVAAGEVSPSEAARRIEGFTRVGDFARVDTAREERIGQPEAILAEGKSPGQVAAIAAEQLADRGHVLVTRVDDDDLAALSGVDAVGETATLEHHEDARCVVITNDGFERGPAAGTVAVVSGGTADRGVAEEAAVTAREFGAAVETYHDVGVAGIHRLLAEVEAIADADCVVVAAGREGALPTIVAGLVDAPVIGLPVPVGYGHGGEGEAALLGLLQSCTVLSVVNVDAGFTAGAQAAKIASGAAGSVPAGED